MSIENKTYLRYDRSMNVSWFNEDLEVYENQSSVFFSIIATMIRVTTLIMAVIVHRAFYKLMKRLPGRAINDMIYPYMVSFLNIKH